MEPILLYFGKMILCSAVMFAYYLLFLKDKTFHHYNRFYLLLSVIISLVLPLIKVSYFTIETNKNLYLLLSQLNQNQLQTTTNNDITIYSVFYTIIGVVSVALLIRLVIGILKINSIKNQFPNETIEGIRFYQTNLNNAPFSFFRNLFWKRSIEINSPVGQQILKHEMVHIEQKHSWDKLLMQISKSLFWFNPVFYFINKEINLIHEYLADKKAVKKSDTKAFAQMLLESHFSGSVLPATSPFLSSNLKKRLTMITKNKTKYSYARKLFALPILFFLVFAYMVNAKNKEIKETNKAIELAVNQHLKIDTIKPKSTIEFDSIAKGHQEKVKLHSDALQEDNLKISALSKKINEKSQEIQKMVKSKKTDTPEFAAKEKEIESLSDQINGIYNSDNYQNNLKALEEHSDAIAKIYESPEYNKKYEEIDRRAKEIEAKINSPEFKKRIADAEKSAKDAEAIVNSPKFQKNLKTVQEQAEKMRVRFSSPEFQKKIEDARKRAKDTEAKVNSPEFQKMIQDAQKKGQELSIKFDNSYNFEDLDKMKIIINDDVFKNIDWAKIPDDFPQNFNFNFDDDFFVLKKKSDLSPKELKKLEKKRKQLFEEQKELQKKQKELLQKQRELNKEVSTSSPWILNTNTTSFNEPRVFVFDDKNLIAANSDLPNIYINGKKVDKSELQKLKPDNISSVNVYKYNNDGKIEVTTK